MESSSWQANKRRHHNPEDHVRPYRSHLVEEVRFLNLQTGWNNSARITAMIPPIMNMDKLKIRYIEPISLWFVVYNQRPSLLQGRGGEDPRLLRAVDQHQL